MRRSPPVTLLDCSVKPPSRAATKSLAALPFARFACRARLFRSFSAFSASAGNDPAAAHAAVLYNLIASAERHGVDPQAYLTGVLAQIAQTPMTQLDQFLPDVWKRHSPVLSGCIVPRLYVF